MSRTCLLCCLLALLVASSAYAQWSSDPAVNLVIADHTSDQAQPKVAPTSDGGCYISWFDGLGTGYDVRVQRLDSAGVEAFAHNGILVADRGFSSTQDYGLDVDASGNALLVFRDDRVSGTQITASKISPTGTLVWGTSGIQLTNTSDYVAAPKIAGTADDGVVVAWTQNSNVHLQKLAADGSQVWGSDVILVPPAGSYAASDLHDAGTDVILSIVHQIGDFYSPKHLVAQKFDSTGATLWGASPIAVFESGSLQFGNYPTFVPDGGGGAVFSWYDTSSLQLQCYAQHIRSDGTEAFPHNGSAVSTSAVRVRVGPSADYNPLTDETFAFWVEENSAQSQWGVYGQRFDGSGNRQWTDSGSVVVPLGTDQVTQVKCHTEGAGAFAFWLKPSGATPDRLYGARLDGSGSIDIAQFYVCSMASDKSRVASGRSTAGFLILAWQDGRTDQSDICAQNVNSDGSLGSPWAGVADGEPASFLIGAPHPNPTPGAIRFECSMPRATSAVLEVYDVRGRVVRSESVNPASRGGVVTWDGRDERGALVPSGVYFLKIRSGAASREVKLTILR
jgi:hypothetical protein